MSKQQHSIAGEPVSPSFTPVPVRARHDGWSPARQLLFIQHLSATACVTEASRAVGMSRQAAYDLYARPDAASFRAAWEAALTVGLVRLENEALGRATNGVATPIFYKGEKVGERRRYDERLTQFLLRYRRPERYGAWRDGATFQYEDADGPSLILQRATRHLAEDLAADKAGKPRPVRQAVAAEIHPNDEDAGAQKAREWHAERMRRMELEAWSDRMERIERGELDPR